MVSLPGYGGAGKTLECQTGYGSFRSGLAQFGRLAGSARLATAPLGRLGSSRLGSAGLILPTRLCRLGSSDQANHDGPRAKLNISCVQHAVHGLAAGHSFICGGLGEEARTPPDLWLKACQIVCLIERSFLGVSFLSRGRRSRHTYAKEKECEWAHSVSTRPQQTRRGVLLHGGGAGALV